LGLTSLTSPSELASRTMFGLAVLVAAGLMVDDARRGKDGEQHPWIRVFPGEEGPY
jgi:hypothetical protein